MTGNGAGMPRRCALHHDPVPIDAHHGARQRAPKPRLDVALGAFLLGGSGQRFQFAQFDRPFIPDLRDRAAEQTKGDFGRQAGKSTGL